MTRTTLTEALMIDDENSDICPELRQKIVAVQSDLEQTIDLLNKIKTPR